MVNTTWLSVPRSEPSALSAGMWQALLATAASLMIAVPAHLAHHFLVGRVRSIVRDIEWSGNEIMKYLLSEYREPRAAEPVNPEAPASRPLLVKK